MTFYWKFVDTLVKNIATISAIVVGVSLFMIRAFNENDGANKFRKFVNQTLRLVNHSTSVVYELVNANVVPVPAIQEVKVVKTRKRAAA
jgi:hypothetical protein